MRNQRIVDKAGEVIGEHANDAVLLVHRPKWSLALFALVVVPVAAGVSLWLVALIGGVVGALLNVIYDYNVLARTNTRLVLLSANGMLVIRPTEVDRDVANTEISLVDKPGINKAVQLGGREFIVPRLYVERLQAMLPPASR